MNFEFHLPADPEYRVPRSSSVIILSDHMSGDFGVKYGVLIKEARILRRAVFVVDRTGKLTYVAYMLALGDEPNYSEVLDAAKAALV